jgi:hypothetical protein
MPLSPRSPGLNIIAKYTVNFGLIATAQGMILEPAHDISIKSQCDRLFDRLVEARTTGELSFVQNRLVVSLVAFRLQVAWTAQVCG